MGHFRWKTPPIVPVRRPPVVRATRRYRIIVKTATDMQPFLSKVRVIAPDVHFEF